MPTGSNLAKSLAATAAAGGGAAASGFGRGKAGTGLEQGIAGHHFICLAHLSFSQVCNLVQSSEAFKAFHLAIRAKVPSMPVLPMPLNPLLFK